MFLGHVARQCMPVRGGAEQDLFTRFTRRHPLTVRTPNVHRSVPGNRFYGTKDMIYTVPLGGKTITQLRRHGEAYSVEPRKPPEKFFDLVCECVGF